jgi:tetratricopeptide (TPR) repeat protein
MIRSTFAASASPRGARRSHAWLLLASLTLPLAIVQAGAPSAEHRIGGSEVSSLSIELAAGDFLGAVVEQDGIDLLVSLFDPQGKAVLEMDSPNDWAWEEELAWVAEQAGTYRLAVRPLDPKAAPGLFRIRVDGPRPARPEDRTRAQAVREMRAALDDYGRFERRLEHLEKTLALWSELGDRHREARALHLIGSALGELSRYEEASERFHQAAALWQELGVPAKQAWSEALALYCQGRIYLKQDPRTAFGYLSKALPLARQARQKWPEMQIAYYLGYACDDLAEKQDALQHFEEALKIARQRQAAKYEVDSLNGLGLVYFSLGDQEKASELCQQAVDLSRAKKLTAQEASALNNLALIYDKSDPGRAREYYHRSLDLGRETRDAEMQATALINLAFLENRTGGPARALELGRQALALGVPIA